MNWINVKAETPPDGLIVIFRVGEAKVKRLGYYRQKTKRFWKNFKPKQNER